MGTTALSGGFTGSYDSVKRFVRQLGRAHPSHPLPMRRMECGPGEEAQVDFGSGAPVLGPNGKPDMLIVDDMGMTKEMKEEVAKARIHKGYERLPLQELIPLHVDQWLNAHKDWKGCRRTRIQAVKRAINYNHTVEKGLVPKNPIRGYKTSKAKSRVTYITPEQKEVLLKNANGALRMRSRCAAVAEVRIDSIRGRLFGCCHSFGS
jgi:hypothetical protein